MPLRQAIYLQPQTVLHPPVQLALLKAGCSRLFLHQAQAIDSIVSGQHTIVCTSTASGKSLCYNVPILQVLSLVLLHHCLHVDC